MMASIVSMAITIDWEMVVCFWLILMMMTMMVVIVMIVV